MRGQDRSRPGHHPPVLCLELRWGSCRPGASLHQAAALQPPKERPGENQSGTLAVRSAQGSRDGFPQAGSSEPAEGDTAPTTLIQFSSPYQRRGLGGAEALRGDLSAHCHAANLVHCILNFVRLKLQ